MRLFFALWPDDQEREAITAVRSRLPSCGRMVARENLHITLRFLGQVAVTERPCIDAAAAVCQGSPFTLCLDRLGYWPRARVLWLGSSETPAALIQLVNALNGALTECGMAAEARPFHAHLTLARKARRPAAVTVPAVTLRLREFCLAASETAPSGVRYRVLERWPLDH